MNCTCPQCFITFISYIVNIVLAIYSTMKKVFVSGCFDMLHSGHVAFLSSAASYGDVHVGIGSDKNVFHLKGRYPVNTEEERKYMLESLKCVASCRVNKGMGILDFEQELSEIQPDIFIVNEDGNTPQKAEYIQDKGIEYVVLKREPHQQLPRRSTTSLRTVNTMPFRIDLAGGWLDQPYVSKYYPGPVLTVSIEPSVEFNERSGMASSTRNKAIEIWRTDIPNGDPEQMARILFSYENPPGTEVITGSQDALGIVMPGLNKLHYTGEYWPAHITSVHDEDILQMIEDHLYLVTLGPRESSYSVLHNTHVTEEGAQALSESAEACWQALMERDLARFGKAFRNSFEAQVDMFPNMVNGHIYRAIEAYRDQAYGWKLSGAGGGGYLIFVSPEEIPGAMQIKIRRKDAM